MTNSRISGFTYMTCNDRVAPLRIREPYRWWTEVRSVCKASRFFSSYPFWLWIFGTAAPQCNWRSQQAAPEAYAERDRLLSMWLPKRDPSLNSFPESPRKYTGGSISLDVLHEEMSARPPEDGGWELRMLPPCSPHHHPPMPFRFLKMLSPRRSSHLAF